MRQSRIVLSVQGTRWPVVSPLVIIQCRSVSRRFGTTPEVSGQFGYGPEVSGDTSGPYPNCLGTEVSWSRSVRKAIRLVALVMYPFTVEKGMTEVAGGSRSAYWNVYPELIRLFPFQVYQTLVKNILLASVKLHLCSTNHEEVCWLFCKTRQIQNIKTTSSKNVYLFIYFVCCLSLWKATCVVNATESFGMECHNSAGSYFPFFRTLARLTAPN